MEEREPSCTVSGNINWCSHYGRQYGGTSKKKKKTRPLLFTHSVVSDSLWARGLQHTRLPCPSPSPRAYSNLRPLSQWCHPTISSSVIPFSSCLLSSPAYDQRTTIWSSNSISGYLSKENKNWPVILTTAILKRL